jgi:GMP synthase (glutamine-hydrolysing)
MRVAIVENMENTHLGTLERALGEAGVRLEWFRPGPPDGTLPSEVDGHDALIVLGGKQSAVDDAEYPCPPALAALMRRFSDATRQT